MKKKFTIYLLFLTILFTGKTQDGSTVYPYTAEQNRKIGWVIARYEHLCVENDSLSATISNQLLLNNKNEEMIGLLTARVSIANEQKENLIEQVRAYNEQLERAEKLIKKQNRVKWYYRGGIILAFGLGLLI